MRVQPDEGEGVWRALLVTVVVGLSAASVAHGQGTFGSGADFLPQQMFTHGQNIAPVFEGWEENADGSFNMVFGTFNRNWEERVHVPVGPDNHVEPGGPDQGQPAYFYPRRNRYVFRVRVPEDFGTKEVVWTLTVHGKTERAYATLHPDYILDSDMVQRNYVGTTPAQMSLNQPPVVSVEGATTRTVSVGEPLALSASVTDDGLLKARAAPKVEPGREPGYIPALGLRVAWFVFRGQGAEVAFDPEQIRLYPDYTGNSPFAPGWLPPPLPADGKFPVSVTFGAPGTYVLKVMAHDGGFGVAQDVTVTVSP